MAVEKERVDVLAVQQGLFTSREQAKRAIMAGEILGVNEQRMDKAGEKIPVTTELHLKGAPMPYVSRGGFKLEKALQVFNIDVQDKTVLDIGSSTGGFTDVSLQNGAKRVYALDVGTNQLVWSLRSDERVIVMENTNFRYAEPEDFKDGQPQVATIDVSFISLNLILPPLSKILTSGGSVATLIKPQFEAGREAVGKHGIVKDAATHSQVINKVADYAHEAGFSIVGLDYSPIKGGSGNIEFLAHLVLDGGDSTMTLAEREAVVTMAHEQLNAHRDGKVDEKTKKERQFAIRNLIANQTIQRQEDVVNALNKMGWDVTQATISRDIAEMQLVKVPLEVGGFAYAVVAQADALAHIKRIIQEPTTTIRTQDNFVMISVAPGTGPALKLALQEADFDELFGILGDDADVLMILKKELQAQKFVTQKFQ